MNKNILIVAGEHSGDIRASELLKELKPLLPDFLFWGVGGERMEQLDVELIEHIRNLSIMGAAQIVKKLPKIYSQLTFINNEVKKRKPSLVILVDYPGFNLKLASSIHKQNIPIIYYVIPQVWAWGAWRLKKIQKYIKKCLVLFDFESRLLDSLNIENVFIGHPLADKIKPEKFPETDHNQKQDIKTIALLPGSRTLEIERMFPVMLDASRIIKGKLKSVNFILAESSSIEISRYDSFLTNYTDLEIKRVRDNTVDCLRECDFAIVTSGTATLETALMGKPMIIGYKASFLTYTLFKIFAKVSNIGLVNIIAEKEIAPEFVYTAANAENMSSKVLEIIDDPEEMKKIKQELLKVKNTLGGDNSAKKAANAVAELVDSA